MTNRPDNASRIAMNRPSPTNGPVHRSILAADIDGFTARTDSAKAHLRQVMCDLIEAALNTAGITGEHRGDTIDRGDGVLVPVHSTDPLSESLLLYSIVPLLAELVAKNQKDRPDQGFRMRAVIHAGDIHYGLAGCFGEALDVASSILDAPEVKRKSLASQTPLLLVVSDVIYRKVVSQEYDRRSFEPLAQMEVAGRPQRGWVYIPRPVANLARPSDAHLALPWQTNYPHIVQVTADANIDLMLHHAGQAIDAHAIARSIDPAALVEQIFRTARATPVSISQTDGMLPGGHPEVGEVEVGIVALWRRYGGTRDQTLRERLILHYAPLVKYVAGRIGTGLPAHVDMADLIRTGILGLTDAIERFEPERGLKFETYAMQRIRGAILDELRSQDWVLRSLRSRARDLERALQQLSTQLQRTPTDQELAKELHISLPELRDLYAQFGLTSVVALDELNVPGQDTGLLTGILPDEDADDPVASLVDQHNRRQLADAIGQLGDRDRVLVTLYYFENLTLAEIGRVLGVTESRVCQLHTRAVLRLRAKLSEHEKGSTNARANTMTIATGHTGPVRR